MGRELADLSGEDGDEVTKPTLDGLKHELDTLQQGARLDDLNPIAQATGIMTPLSIQHSAGDASTPATASLELAARRYLADKVYQLKIYPGSDHLFTGQQFERAVARELAWFQRHR